MRKAILILTIILLTAVSCKKRTQGTMTVIKDCTGTYLRYADKDYPICNEDKLDEFTNGTVVDASFVNDDKCVSGRQHCAMVHGHEMELGQFRVTRIKL
jgi:hypothetical protein